MSKNLEGVVREPTGCTAAVHGRLEGMCMRGIQDSGLRRRRENCRKKGILVKMPVQGVGEKLTFMAEGVLRCEKLTEKSQIEGSRERVATINDHIGGVAEIGPVRSSRPERRTGRVVRFSQLEPDHRSGSASVLGTELCYHSHQYSTNWDVQTPPQ
jgi:hypothetical protein